MYVARPSDLCCSSWTVTDASSAKPVVRLTGVGNTVVKRVVVVVACVAVIQKETMINRLKSQYLKYLFFVKLKTFTKRLYLKHLQTNFCAFTVAVLTSSRSLINS